MTKCDYCYEDIIKSNVSYSTGGLCNVVKETISLPFTCKRCGGNYCSECRLPENHNCNGIGFENGKFVGIKTIYLNIEECISI